MSYLPACPHVSSDTITARRLILPKNFWDVLVGQAPPGTRHLIHTLNATLTSFTTARQAVFTPPAATTVAKSASARILWMSSAGRSTILLGRSLEVPLEAGRSRWPRGHYAAVDSSVLSDEG